MEIERRTLLQVDVSLVEKPVMETDEHTQRTDLSYDSSSQTSYSTEEDDIVQVPVSSPCAEPASPCEAESDGLSGNLDSPTHQLKRRGSILRSSAEPLHIKDSGKAWKCLPKPDLDLLRNSSVTSTESISTSRRDSLVSSGVRFDSVKIRSYSQTIGDNPSVSYGTPIQLDWDYEEHEPIDIDKYEDARPKRRTFRQMILNYYQRRNILTWQYGFSEEEITASKRAVKKIKSQRSLTTSFLPIMKMEDMLESAGRKAKRMMKKSQQ